MNKPDIPKFAAKGPIFCIKEESSFYMREYFSVLPKPEDRLFINAIVRNAIDFGTLDATNKDEVAYLLDIEQLKASVAFNKSKIALGKTVLNERLNNLVDSQVMSRNELTSVILDKMDLPVNNLRGKKFVYTLLPADQVIANAKIINEPKPFKVNSHRDKKYYETLQAKEQQLISIDATMLVLPQDSKHAYSERLLNNVFFACGRLSVRDPRKKRIETSYPFKGENIRIVATSGGDVDLFSLDDQNTVLAIITMVIFANGRRSREGKPNRNEYYLDIAHLCNICGLDASGANRETLRKSIDRLYFSNLNVSCPPNSQFAQFFGLSSFTDNGQEFTPNNMDFRFLWQRDSASIEEDLAESRKPRYYKIALHPLIYSQLLDPEIWNTFVINPELLKNRLRLVTHLYFFAARMIARVPGKNLSWPLRSVHNQIMPASNRYDNWKKSLFSELKTYAKNSNQVWDSEECTLDLFGYFVKISKNAVYDYRVTFWFNEKDPILGIDGLVQKLAQPYEQTELSFKDVEDL